MAVRYHPAQSGTAILITALLAAIVIAALAAVEMWSPGRLPWNIVTMIAVLVPLGLSAFIFSSMTVEVNEREAQRVRVGERLGCGNPGIRFNLSHWSASPLLDPIWSLVGATGPHP